MGSQVVTIAKPVYEASLPPTVQKGHALLVNLKAANNSPVQTLGVIQVDIEIWGQTVKKRVVVVVQEALDPQVILSMNVLQECDQEMAQELGPIYCKGLPGNRPPQVALWKILW